MNTVKFPYLFLLPAAKPAVAQAILAYDNGPRGGRLATEVLRCTGVIIEAKNVFEGLLFQKVARQVEGAEVFTWDHYLQAYGQVCKEGAF